MLHVNVLFILDADFALAQASTQRLHQKTPIEWWFVNVENRTPASPFRERRIASMKTTSPNRVQANVRCFIVEDANLVGICGICNTCGSDVAKYLCNASVQAKRHEAVMFDMWAACTNPDCVNHDGRGYYMDAPDFFTPNARLDRQEEAR